MSKRTAERVIAEMRSKKGADGKVSKTESKRYTPRPMPKPRSGKPVLGLEAARRAYLDLCTDPSRRSRRRDRSRHRHPEGFAVKRGTEDYGAQAFRRCDSHRGRAWRARHAQPAGPPRSRHASHNELPCFRGSNRMRAYRERHGACYGADAIRASRGADIVR